MSYSPTKEWLVIDKINDFLYFDKTKDIAKYFNLTLPQVNSIYTTSLININKYSPSKELFIQRLFVGANLPPRDYTKTPYSKYAIKYIYPNINELMLFCIGILGAIGALCIIIQKSKCEEINCFCFKCKRDVKAVINAEKLALGRSVNETPRKLPSPTPTIP